MESFHRHLTVLSMEISTGRGKAENSGGRFRLWFVIIIELLSLIIKFEFNADDGFLQLYSVLVL